MGTLGYMAPEMMLLLNRKSATTEDWSLLHPHTKASKQAGYGPSVDWWSLGVTVYKLLTGEKPFTDELREWITLRDADEALIDENNNFQEYYKLFKRVQFPPHVSDEARDLITQLLRVDKTRLGTGREGVKNLKKHPWFKSVDWSLLEQKQVEPPFKPDTDRGVLEAYPSLEALLGEHGKGGWFDALPPERQQEHFVDWDFTSPHTIRVEAGLSSVMQQYDRSTKVRRIMGAPKSSQEWETRPTESPSASAKASAKRGSPIAREGKGRK
ncbi:kinase-like domain-containing protein [Ochromonadaceae sp. CCMP2298]|nr:kinase-like domain-containing protein [Ochromonadaceae sp. CCMP2298]